jgi:inner membrane transporter RhtA
MTRGVRAQLRHPPAAALVAAGAFSVQFGAAVAIRLFDQVGPAGAATIRLGVAAVLLVGWARPRLRTIRRSDLGVAVSFGLVLAAMNLLFYEAIARIPLGVAVTIEFSGPLALALIGSRRWLDLLWAALAGTGVALFTSGGGHLDPVGIGFAFLAGAAWIGYILLSQQTGRRFDAHSGLSIAMAAGALAILPIGLVAAGTTLFHPHVLLVGAAVALLSSVVPYSLELVALRQVTPRAFGVLLSMDPAVAAIAGVVVLGQHLTTRELIALLLVSAANLGNALVGRPGVVATTP